MTMLYSRSTFFYISCHADLLYLLYYEPWEYDINYLMLSLQIFTVRHNVNYSTLEYYNGVLFLSTRFYFSHL